MIEFGKAYAIGNGALLKSDTSILENGVVVGRIYFMPLGFNAGHPYNVTLKSIDCGFFASIADAKSYCESGTPEPKKYY